MLNEEDHVLLQQVDQIDAALLLHGVERLDLLHRHEAAADEEASEESLFAHGLLLHRFTLRREA